MPRCGIVIVIEEVVESTYGCGSLDSFPLTHRRFRPASRSAERAVRRLATLEAPLAAAQRGRPEARAHLPRDPARIGRGARWRGGFPKDDALLAPCDGGHRASSAARGATNGSAVANAPRVATDETADSAYSTVDLSRSLSLSLSLSRGYSLVSRCGARFLRLYPYLL